MGRPVREKEKMLTEVELEMMQILWKTHGGTVNDVLQDLPKARRLAYTSVSTILRILEQKGFLKAEKEGRGHLYQPVISKADYESKSVNHLVDKVFENAPSALVRRLLDEKGISPRELKEIRDLLNEKLA